MTGPDRPGAHARHGDSGDGPDGGAGGTERSPVRPYAVTGGRKTRTSMPPETVVAADGPADGPRRSGGHPPEADRILALCRPWCSVAEISAHAHLPLGVVRVLVEDLVDDGLVRLHSPSPSGEDTDQLERALRELRKRI